MGNQSNEVIHKHKASSVKEKSPHTSDQRLESHHFSNMWLRETPQLSLYDTKAAEKFLRVFSISGCVS